MANLSDEGFMDEDDMSYTIQLPTFQSELMTTLNAYREELVYRLLASMPRSLIAKVHRRIAPFLQFDIVGTLPSELSLNILSYLPYYTLLRCALVSKKWRTLADDQSLWKALCKEKGWGWKQPLIERDIGFLLHQPEVYSLDEGMGEDSDLEEVRNNMQDLLLEPDSGFSCQEIEYNPVQIVGLPATPRRTTRSTSNASRPRPLSPGPTPPQSQGRHRTISSTRSHRHSAPSILPTAKPHKPNYKLLYQTHILLHNRLLHGNYKVKTLQTRGTPNSHSSTIYCLQLYTYPEDGTQVLFTGSRDKTVREWDLSTGTVIRLFEGVHNGSVLSLCAKDGYLACAGSDWVVSVWELRQGSLVGTIRDHVDSVLGVRFDEQRLVSCSKDHTIRTYHFPSLKVDKVLLSHRAAVNAVALSNNLIVSASGDKAIRVWDAITGSLLWTFEDHHSRGIASIDFQWPFVVSGSSDRHVRLFDITTKQGWSTNPEVPDQTPGVSPSVCDVCGRTLTDNEVHHGISAADRRTTLSLVSGTHRDLVRAVALGSELVISGSYDRNIKVWERRTGALQANLHGPHEGRIFSVAFDCTKIVSCGEDQKICIWDFSHGIDTSFIKL